MATKSTGTSALYKGGSRKPASGTYGGQLDIVATYDTRYPDHHCRVKAGDGNGPHPKNPFSRKFKKPNIG